jgi:nitrate reductase gamma subunit
MSTFFAVLLLAATVFMLGGLARKINQYRKTPAPLKIPTTPAPRTTGGVVLRMAKEVIFFAALFRASKWTWIFGWMFHFALLLAFFRHLRYVITPDGALAFLWPVISLDLVQSGGKYAGIAMVIGLLGLLGRRIFVARVRYISAPSDYLMLILLMIIGISGLVMSFVSHIDIMQMKAFVAGMFSFDFQELPVSVPLMVHLGLVAVLAFVLPISKLLHIPGVFFSPARNQVDNSREQRHIADWAKKLDETRSS